MLQRLAAHAEAAAAQHGVHSMQAQAALDVCLHMAEGMSGLLEACCRDREAGEPAPAWLASLLRLYSLVPDAGGSGSGAANGGAAPPPPLTILHADFLSSFCQLGPLAMPLLLPMAQPGAAHQQQQQQGLMHLVLRQALRALSSQSRTADVAAGSTQDVAEQAANALRVLCR